MQVSLDGGESFTEIEGDAETILSKTSITVVENPEIESYSPKLINKTSQSSLEEVIFTLQTVNELRPEPVYECKVTKLRENQSSQETVIASALRLDRHTIQCSSFDLSDYAAHGINDL